MKSTQEGEVGGAVNSEQCCPPPPHGSYFARGELTSKKLINSSPIFLIISLRCIYFRLVVWYLFSLHLFFSNYSCSYSRNCRCVLCCFTIKQKRNRNSKVLRFPKEKLGYRYHVCLDEEIFFTHSGLFYHPVPNPLHKQITKKIL